MHEFSSLLASYKLKGITKVRYISKNCTILCNRYGPHFLQADLSVVTAFFRNARSGLVHLAAVKQEFQLEIKPIPLLSKMVRVCVCLYFTCLKV